MEGETCDLESGSWARVPAGASHTLRNVGEGDFKFLCSVPTHGDPHAKKHRMRADRKKKKHADD